MRKAPVTSNQEVLVTSQSVGKNEFCSSLTGMAELASLVQRLELAVGRLEAMSGPGGSSTGGSAGGGNHAASTSSSPVWCVCSDSHVTSSSFSRVCIRGGLRRHRQRPLGSVPVTQSADRRGRPETRKCPAP